MAMPTKGPGREELILSGTGSSVCCAIAASNRYLSSTIFLVFENEGAVSW